MWIWGHKWKEDFEKWLDRKFEKHFPDVMEEVRQTLDEIASDVVFYVGLPSIVISLFFGALTVIIIKREFWGKR